jgi:hypothetical protein
MVVQFEATLRGRGQIVVLRGGVDVDDSGASDKQIERDPPAQLVVPCGRPDLNLHHPARPHGTRHLYFPTALSISVRTDRGLSDLELGISSSPISPLGVNSVSQSQEPLLDSRNLSFSLRGTTHFSVENNTPNLPRLLASVTSFSMPHPRSSRPISPTYSKAQRPTLISI